MARPAVFTLAIALFAMSSVVSAQSRRMEPMDNASFLSTRSGARIGLDGRLSTGPSSLNFVPVSSVAGFRLEGVESDGRWNELGAPGRIAAKMVLDAAHDRLVLFGGTPAYDGRDYRYSNDTWVLDLHTPTAWKRLDIEGSLPEPRAGHCVAYDPLRNRLIVFGGFRALHEGDHYEFRYLGDTWALSLNGRPQWTQLASDDSTMGRRTGTAMAYDAVHDRVLAYGGFFIDEENPGDYYGTHFEDLHALDLSSASARWTEVAVSGGPGPRAFHALLRDEAGKRILLFGGQISTKGPIPEDYAIDLWALPDDVTSGWARIDPVNDLPPLRNDEGVEWDSNRGQLLLFGGFPLVQQNNYLTNETWMFDVNGSRHWTQLAQGEAAPLPRQDLATWFDTARDRFLIAGGWGEAGCGFADTWQLARPSDAWSELSPPGSAIAFRSSPSYGFDSVNRELILYGGDLLGGEAYWPLVPDAVQAYDVDKASWRRIETAGAAPPTLSRPASAFDPIHRRLWLVGGTPEFGEPIDDTWALDLAGTPAWRTLPAGTRPSAREGAVAVYDPLGDRVLLYGGATGAAGSEVWSLHGDAWTQLPVEGTPIPNRRNAVGVYDSKRHRMVVLGGEPYDGMIRALSLDGTPSWQAIPASGSSPMNRSGARAVYDPDGDRILVFGGQNPGQFFADVFDVDELSLGESPEWRHLQPTGAPSPARTEHALVYDQSRHRLLVTGGWDGFFLWHGETYELSFAPTILSISIDVKENLPAVHRGPILVTLLSSPAFDPSRVDVSSLRLEGAPALRTSPSQGRTDRNGDGIADLAVSFDGALVEPHEPANVLTVRGRLVDGIEFEGSATVVLRPNPVHLDSESVGPSPVALGLRVLDARSGGTVHFAADFPRAGAWSLDFYDVRGRRIDGSAGTVDGGRSGKIDLPAARGPGIYFARLTQGEAMVRLRFVVL